MYAVDLDQSKRLLVISAVQRVSADEVKAVARPAMRHRLNIRAELAIEGTTADSVLETILAVVPTPR